jgi:xanthosine utilization system XapX-like protein
MIIAIGIALVVGGQSMGWVLIVLGVLAFIVTSLIWGLGLTDLVFGSKRGQRYQFSDLFDAGTRYFGVYFLTAFLYIMITAVPVGIVSVILNLALPPLKPLVSFLRGILSIYLGFRLFAIRQVVISEELSYYQNLVRSWNLTSTPFGGYAAKRYFAWVAIVLPIILVVIVLILLYVIMIGSNHFGHLLKGQAPEAIAILPLLLLTLPVFFAIGIYSIYYETLLYLDLRHVRDEDSTPDGSGAVSQHTPGDSFDFNQVISG